MKRQNVFSMVEVMVVFAITATLISILVTSIKTSKDVALKATCMSNISQIRNYAELYRKDNNNLPYSEIWLTDFSWVEPYTNPNALAVFNCPGDDDALELTSFNQLRYSTSYFYVPSATQMSKNIQDGQLYGVLENNIPDLALSQDAAIYDKSSMHHNGSINIAYLFKSDDPDFNGDRVEHGTIAVLHNNPTTNPNNLLAMLDDGTISVPDLADDPIPEVEEITEEITDEIVDFTIEGGAVVIEEEATVTYEILGTAISYGGQYDMPVTAKIRFNSPEGESTIVEPFGSYSSATNGSVVAGQTYSPEGSYSPGTALTVATESWKKKRSRYDGTSDSHWSTFMQVDSNSSNNVIVLRNGDSVPQIDGFLDQGNVESYLGGYISNGQVSLGVNQAIYLFELGTTNLDSTAADFQDCVVLVTLFPAKTTVVSSN